MGWLKKYQNGGYSTTGYKADSPDRNNPYNIIPSGRITMQNVPHPVLGIDNLGNRQMMKPGGEYQFQGDQVFEVPVMQGGGIPERYKNMGFTHVGQKKSGNGQHKWKVLAKKGDSYKVVQGGYRGMQDFKQHHSEERKDRFWDRMGGRDSSKAKDPFSPLYWHKRFGTWEYGGPVEMQGGGVAPYITHDPNDPRIQSYKDSTDLYNLYKLQERIHGNSQNIPASYFLNMSPSWATQMGEENRNLRRKARPDENPRFNAWSMALGNNPITNRELENYERRSRLPFDPRGIVDKGDQDIINAAKGLNNPNVYTANRQSPDIYHPSIKPMGYYIETPRNGQAKGSVNHIYKNPEQKVIYEPPATSKTVIKTPSKKVTKVISVDPVNPINVIQIPEKKTKYQFIKKDSHGVRESPIMDERVEPEWYATPKYKQGGMIKRADGSYSKRGLWDNIRANAGSGKKPTKEMLQQERKIRSAEKKEYGGWLDHYQSGGTIAKDGKLLAPSSPYPDMDPAMLQSYRQMQRQMEMLSTPEGRRVLAGEAYQKNRKQKTNQAKIEDKETLQRMKDKAAQQRAESDPSMFNPSFWKEDPMSGRTATQRLEDMGTDLQTRVFQTGNKTYDSYLNTPGYIAHMAGNLAKTPAEAQRQNSVMPYVTALGEPLLVGAGEAIAEPYINKAIKNIYKINPYATKLNNPNAFYRIADEASLNDALESGVVRSNSLGAPGETIGNVSLNRLTPFPSFAKGKPAFDYLPEEGLGYIYESKQPMLRRGDINPITGKQIKGRHWAHRPFDLKTGKVISELPLDQVNIYKAEPHWLKGYQEIKKPLIGESNVPISDGSFVIKDGANAQSIIKELPEPTYPTSPYRPPGGRTFPVLPARTPTGMPTLVDVPELTKEQQILKSFGLDPYKTKASKKHGGWLSKYK